MKTVWHRGAMTAAAVLIGLSGAAGATGFTTTVPGTGVQLPDEYPEAGGVAIVMTGVNGNIYYQFSDPDGAFRGFQFRGQPSRFRGNPFTINDPINLDCGFRSCTDYFGGTIARIDIRFSAFDGDTQPGGFDNNDINLLLNGFDVGSWSGLQTEVTNTTGTNSFGFATGFGNNTFNTGWFSSTNAALLGNILATNSTTTQVFDDDPDDNFWDFTRGPNLPRDDLRTIAPGYEFEKTLRNGETAFLEVGEVYTYDYVVRNIGSVDIEDITVVDDRIATVSCPANNDLDAVPAGSPAPNQLVCSGTYRITQEDVDAGEVTNIARANGTPEFGQLGEVEDTRTLVGPPFNDAVTLEKVGSPDPFGDAGSDVTYDFTVTNTGNTTLRNVVVTDPRLPQLSCTIPVLAPLSADNTDNTETCQAAYQVTQPDVDAFIQSGTLLTNTASVTANGAAGTATDTASDTLNGPVAAPALTVVKTSPTPSYAAVGDIIEYRIAVTNDGNVTWPGPPTITDVLTGGATCPAGAVSPNATVTCTATYSVEQPDIDAGSRENTASASITVDGQTASGSDSTTVDADLRPALEVVKTLSSGPNPFDALNQQLVYQYEVSNTGNVVVNAPSISDDRITASCAATTIPAGQSVICTSDPYVIDQDDLDLGSVTNVASATADVPGGGTVTSPDTSLTVPSDAAPAFTLTKVSTDSFTAVDDLVTYTLSVTNPGPLTLASVTVSDPLVPGYSCTLTNVAPNNTPQDCPTQAEYTVIQEDLDRGFIDNTATAVGTATTGTQVTETASERVEPTAGALTRSLDLIKTASPETFAGPGETITYTLAVENTGTQTLTNVVVEDTALGLTCTIASIAPTLTDSSCTGTRLTTADDFDTGTFVNDAIANADGVPDVPGQATITATGRNAGFELTKTPDMTAFAQVGDRIRFTLSIQNTGNVSVNAITLTDELFDPDLTCSIATLPVGITDTSCFGTYTVQQADIDRGSITNDADAAGTGADGTALVDDTQITINGPARNPSVSVEKIERDGSGDFVSGIAENYDFTVRNTGNVTLAAGGTITDGLTGFTCALPELAPGAETTTCQNGDLLTTEFTPDQQQVDAGSLANTVDVSATAVGGGAASASDTVTLNGPTQRPDLSLSKQSVPVSATFAAVGDRIDYAYTVVNTGNVTITEPITIADDRVTVSCPALPAGGLAPNAPLTCSAFEIVTQTELDAGTVINEATASVTQGVVPSALFPDGLAVIESDPATETVNAVQTPALSLVKRIKPGTPSTYDGPGDLGDAGNANNLIFEFLVTNSGNVTTTAPILVEDFNIPANITCAPLGVAPGETIACEAPWAPTQTQVNDGSFDNDAEATTEFAGATTTSNRDTATATAIRRPELATTKALAGISGGSFAAGATITYDYTVTNTGNVTVEGPIEIDDNLIPRFTCQGGSLLPGATATCTGDYIITASDVDQFGSVTNIATGLGTTPQGPVESDPVSLTVPPGANPSLQIAKAVTPPNTEITTEGQVLNYVFTVTNNSSGTFPPAFNDNITITDSRIGTFSCPLVGVGPTLSVGESYQCFATDMVDQADLDAVSADQMMGFVTNSAVANSVFGGDPVISNAAIVTVPGAANDLLAVEKTATPRAPAAAPVAADDIIDYSIVVRNDGNRTLTNVIVRDPRIPDLSCDVAAPISLAPDAFTTCTGAYTVEQADIDTQSLTNTASAEGAAPDGMVVEGQGDAVVLVEGDAPLLEVIKTVVGGSTGTDFTDPGQPLTFQIEVRNIGNVTIDGINVTDSLVPGVCAVGSLAPGDSDTTCEFEYVVTQDDINTGEVNNTATALGTARTPDADPVTDDGNAQATGPLREPSIAVSKTGTGPLADGRFDADEQVLDYEFVLLNTGNVTLEGPVTVTDSVIGPIDCAPVFPANGLLPAEAITCTGSYEVDQFDVDRGEVTNTVDVAIPDPTDPLNNPPIIADTSLTIESDRRPSFTVIKLADPTTMVMVGDDITYSYTVTNTGNVTLTDIVLDDQQTSASGTESLDIEDDGEIANLAPGTAVTLTATYEVTQGDIDAGNALTNTVTAEAVPPAGLPALDSETADASVTPEAGTGGLEVRKTVRTPPAAPEAGQTVIFEVQVENTGNVTLDAITQTETVLRADGVPATGTPLVIFEGGDTGATADAIDVGETWIYRVEYTLEQLDVDAGGITNSIRFDATDPQDGPVFDVSDSGTGAGDAPTPVTLTPSSSLEVLKTVRTLAGTPPNAGDTVVFEIQVENTGQTTLSAPVLDDDLTRADGDATLVQPEPIFETGDTGAIPSNLDVDETWVYRVEYVLEQADIDAGGLSNTVVATANPPTGPPVNDTSDDGTGGVGGSTPTAIPLAGEPEIETIKRVLGPVPARPLPDDLLQFEITVRNAGNVTLAAPTLSDVLIPTGGVAIDPAPVPMFDDGDTNGDGSLSVGETWVYILDFPLTQSVIDAGGLTNQVTATTSAPDGTVINDPSDPNGPGDAPTPVTLPRDPGITGLKAITNSASLDGDVVRFEITATNTGNTTLTAVSVPSDTLTRADNTPLTLTTQPQFVSNDDGSPQGTLRPGETATFRATYILGQEDIDAGGIRNQANVTGTPPGLPPVTDLTGNGTPGGEDDPTELTIIADPSLSLVKRLVSGGASVSAVDDPLVYAFDVTNTGNVTAAAISITDQRLIDAGVAVVCPPTLLAPDASLTCEATYLVTQDDLDADPPILSNSATATDGVATSDPSTVDVAVQQMPALMTDKEAISVEFEGTTFGPGVPPAQFRVDAVVTYLFTVTNTGNVTLRDEVTIDDNLIDVTCDPLPAEGLRPTLTLECTGTHLVTSDDVDLASVTNLATATSGTTDSPPTSETVPNDGTPNLGIVKTLISGDEFTSIDDVLTYQFEVTNTGEVAFTRDIIVQDTLLADNVVCFTASAADPDFAAGETVTCEGTYLVTQEDLDRGEVLNAANAQTTFGDSDREVVSPPSNVTAMADPDPELTLTKTVATLPVTAVDQILTYTLVAQNTGNQTLRLVEVTDQLLPDLSCSIAELAPGASLSCSSPYTVTQDDFDAPTLVNTANATSVDPAGDPAEDMASVTVDMPAATPGLTMVKSAQPEPFGPDGSIIEYRFRLENTGNVTLRDVTVIDELVDPPFECVVAELRPDTVDDSTCVLGYPVTQEDVDRGSILNTANATSVPARGEPPTATDTVSVRGATAEPSLSAEKRASIVGEPVVDTVVTYTLEVINTGNVTLAVTGIEDTITRDDGTLAVLDAPFAFVDGDANGDGRLGLREVWLWTAQYTITQADIDAGGFENSATVNGTAPDGAPVSDISDDGIDDDGNTSDDPTRTAFTRAPAIEVIKSITTPGAVAGDVIIYEITATNIGNTTLADLEITDTLTDVGGASVTPDAPPALVGPPAAALSLAPGDSVTYELPYTLTQSDIDAGGLSNTATVSSRAPDLQLVSDVSDDANPAAGDGDADPTVLLIESNPSATLEKTAGDVRRAGGTLFDVPFTLTAENTGNVTLTGLSLTDDVAAFAAPARVVSVTGLTVSGLTAGGANTGFNGLSDIETLDAAATLAPDAVATVTFTVRLDTADGAPANPNTVTLASDQLDEDLSASVTVNGLSAPALVVTKSVTPAQALIGDTVTYTIQVENTGGFTESDLSIVDELPAGLVYTPDTARLDTVLSEPVILGRTQSWSPVTLAPSATTTVTLQARVTDGPGEFVNRAFVRDSFGAIVSNVATAVLQVRPEAVFDCGDVIGRVFDDVDLDGYYDGDANATAGVSDQTYDASKGAIAPARSGPRVERGLPRVRIATVDGSIITTDEHGRFNVPCALLPRDIGSNFTLKLDPSSLPTGYHVTTENPRTVRLTPGRLAKMNFGAALADVVDIALTAEAFSDTAPSRALRDGLAAALPRLAEAPVILRLTYNDAGEGGDVARARLDAVEALIREGWPRGRTRPVIERTLVRGN